MNSTVASSSDKPGPLVSVVIPTRNRANVIGRSVNSALAQSFRNIEVIVVLDGCDSATTATLNAIADTRLQLLALPEPVGGAEARNRGVQAAKGDWIAFLDDDDEWLPCKLDKQLQAAARSSAPAPVICSAYFARSSDGEHIFGHRSPLRSEPISEYMFARRGLAYGENAVATSVLMAPRLTLLEVPFDRQLKRHQDWDWALSAMARPGTELCYVSEPLSIYHMHEGLSRISGHSDWQYSLEWCRSRRKLFTPKAISFFIATECVTRARLSGARLGELAGLVRAFFKEGRPSLRSLSLLVWCLIAPRRLRRRLLRLKFASRALR